MYFLLSMGIFHCYLRLPEGTICWFVGAQLDSSLHCFNLNSKTPAVGKGYIRLHAKVGTVKKSGGFFGKLDMQNWLVVSNIFYFHPYLGKISNLTIIFQLGWNHQLEKLLNQPTQITGENQLTRQFSKRPFPPVGHPKWWWKVREFLPRWPKHSV